MRNFFRNVNVLLFSILFSSHYVMHAMEVDDDFPQKKSAFTPLMHDSAMQQMSGNQEPFTRLRSNALTPHDFDRMPRATSQESGFDSENHLNERPESVFFNLDEDMEPTSNISEFGAFNGDNEMTVADRRPSTSFEAMIDECTKPVKRKRRHNTFESNSDEEFEDDQNPQRFQ